MSALVFALEPRRPSRLGHGRIGVIGEASGLVRMLSDSAAVQWHVTGSDCVTPDSWRYLLDYSPVETLVFVPRSAREPDLRPDLIRARAALTACRHAGATHLVLVSSTAVYGASPRHAGLAPERPVIATADQPLGREWLELESLAHSIFVGRVVTVLRAAPVPARDGRDFFSQLLQSRVAFPVAGYDPTLQFLSIRDLARSVQLAIERRPQGIFNIVPSAPVPLRAALRAAGVRAVPVPWTVQAAARALLRPFRAASPAQARFIRYHLTASPDRAARDFGFVARDASLGAIRAISRTVDAEPSSSATADQPRFDEHGLDREFIHVCSRGVLGFLHRRYWRVETKGLEHIPSAGGGVLVGMHRGFMPFDGVMTLLSVVEGTGRVPRFLIHPGVGLRFPFLFNLMSKLGGVIACQENGDRVLSSGELLGVYPEGIRGAFTMYRRAHRIGPSWRNDCIAFALRHGVPILPFVTVGSAEIFPILGRINSRWWKQFTEWPFIPITPTFPLLPVPLPSKWSTLFLPPLHVERQYPSEAAEDRAVVRALGAEVRRRMEAAVAELVARRRSIFFGSAFEKRVP